MTTRFLASGIRILVVSVFVCLLLQIELRASGADFHAQFDRLLQANVSKGLVYYQGFDNAEFNEYLEKLASASPDSWPRNAQLAFWINAYNASAIRQVLDNRSLKQPTDKADFFKEVKFTVAGRKLSLDQIENEVIRPQFKESLIHFGVVCAAVGCPKLIGTAYTADKVISLLKSNLRAYLSSPAGLKIDRNAKSVQLSKIFEWYRVDFAKSDADLIAYVKPYVDKETAAWLAANSDSISLAFLDYDWTLNKRASRP